MESLNLCWCISTHTPQSLAALFAFVLQQLVGGIHFSCTSATGGIVLNKATCRKGSVKADPAGMGKELLTHQGLVKKEEEEEKKTTSTPKSQQYFVPLC